MLSSLLNACVTPRFCCAPLRTWLVPHGECHGLGPCVPKAQKFTTDSNHLAVPGLGTSAMAKNPGCHFGHSSLSLSLRGAGCAAARHNPLGTSEVPLGALGITNYPSMAELSTAAPLQSS